MDYFLNAIMTKFLTKVAQTFDSFLAHFEQSHFLVKALVATFWANLDPLLSKLLVTLMAE